MHQWLCQKKTQSGGEKKRFTTWSDFLVSCWTYLLYIAFQGKFLTNLQNTVDGRNPAPVEMENLPLFTGFCTCQVVQDFFHQQYGDVFLLPNCWSFKNCDESKWLVSVSILVANHNWRKLKQKMPFQLNIHEAAIFLQILWVELLWLKFCCSNIVFCVDEIFSPLFGYFWGVDCWSNTVTLRIRQFDDCRHIFRHLEQWKAETNELLGSKKGIVKIYWI